MAENPIVGANVVISSPAQMFTRTDQFQALFNGKIFIGQIDKDPSVKENQINVYIEQEDGSLLAVAQPLRTNAAGFPVYLGKVVKFVTTEGHSMALYDSRNVLMNYYPNVLKYDPDQFSSAVGRPDGLKVIGRAVSVAQLRQIAGRPDQWINLASYDEGTHMGGGFFYWVADFNRADDGGMFFRVNASGGWMRDLPATETLTAVHFGAVPDPTKDAIPAMKRMHAWSNAQAQSRGLSEHFGPGIILPSGSFGVSSWDLGDAEIRSFKLQGAPTSYGVMPSTVLVPLSKTTTSPVFTARARRTMFNYLYWWPADSVQPFYQNKATRGEYVRVHCFVNRDNGGRVFQLVDTLDTKFDQVYSYSGTKAFLWTTWSNENPGRWDHVTAIELSNANFNGHTGEFAVSAIRAGQSRMVNVWFDHCENSFDISQGGWYMDTVIQEGATNPSAMKNAKTTRINCRFAQGATLDYERSGYDASMDINGQAPNWVYNTYDQGTIDLNITGSNFNGGLSANFNFDSFAVQRTNDAEQWVYIGSMTQQALGHSCELTLIGGFGWDSVGETISSPNSTNFGGGKAVIKVQAKDVNNSTTSRGEVSWHGEGSVPIKAVRYTRSYRTVQLYVLLGQYSRSLACYMQVSGWPRSKSGSPFYFTPSGELVTADKVADAKVASARWAINGGLGNDNAGIGFDLDNQYLLLSSNKINTPGGGMRMLSAKVNNDTMFIPLMPESGSIRFPRYTLAGLPTAATSPHSIVFCTDTKATPPSQPLFSDGSSWYLLSDPGFNFRG